MGRVQFALEIFLAIFASWTLSYELALLVRIPAVATIIPWALLLIPIVWYLIGTRRQRCEASTSKGALLAVSAVALLAGAFTLFVHRPDPDDLTFFHRALDQKWCEPFLTGDDTLNVTRLNVRPLPEESILHSMCSYEPLITLAARALKRNPLAAYQIGAPFLIAVALVYVYFLGYRTLGIGEWPAAGAALAACTFLVLDGNNHGSFGNMSLDRLWQGKCVVFTLLIPALAILCYRFLSKPSFRDFVLLVMLGISGAGLSEVGVFTLPILVLSIAVGFLGWGTSRSIKQRSKLTLIVCVSMIYPVVIGLALMAGILHKPADPSIWNNYPDIWYRNLAFVIGDASSSNRSIIEGALRDLSILSLLPLVALGGTSRRYLAAVSTVLIVLVANPMVAPLWMKLLYRNSYWRLAYLFPVPLSAGLIAPAIAGVFRWKGPRQWAAAGAVILAIMTVALAFRQTIALPIGPTRKGLMDLQLPPEEAGLSRRVAPLLKGHNILGPEQFVWTLALIDPSLRFESTRSVVVPVKLGDVGLRSEAQRRLRAQSYTDCEKESRNGFGGDFIQSIENGVDAVIVRKCAEAADDSDNAREFMKNFPDRWCSLAESQHYCVFVKCPPADRL